MHERSARLALIFSICPFHFKVKTGGVYIPPFKLARMMADVSDRSSPEYQRLTWEALKKSLNGIINKVNTTNIKAILVEVFREVRCSGCPSEEFSGNFSTDVEVSMVLRTWVLKVIVALQEEENFI
jgi:hypothetical protein